jgi:tetratricopeptide (TPR) repeat protein
MGVFLAVLALALSLGACSSAPRKQDQPEKATLTAADSAVIKDALETMSMPKDLDVAHESFIRAQEMELRGEKQLAEVFWQRAYEADPGNRYLAFSVASRLQAHGNDSAALAIARKAARYKGPVLANQLELLAKLYVREGIADSARKYFKAALDSSHNQDMTLLYDYSLFLEAVQDKKELVKVYDALLPQTNYIQSLFARQVNLLLELGKDSAIVELFGKAYDATGDKELLSKMVQGLALQKRFGEVRAIADTVTGKTETDEEIINSALLTYGETEREAALKFLKKKVYEDSMRTPVMLYYLGSYEFALGEKDSAKVHLDQVYLKLGKNQAYAAQACRALSGIAFAANQKKEGLRYAELSDSLQLGGDKNFLALAYGYAGVYEGAYALLDSMMDVWSHWTPMAGVADSATMGMLRLKARRAHRQLQHSYAQILLMEARSIEDDGLADTLKRAHAREARTKAELFWESMLMSDSSDMFVRSMMAMNLERLERYEESFQMFEFLLKNANPSLLDWPEILNYYGYSLIDLNRSPEEVEKGYQMVVKALELDKGGSPNEAYLDSKAWGLYRKGMYEEAFATLSLIKDKNFEKDYVYWEHLAAIQAALGKKADATKSYKKLLKLRPNHAAAKEFLGKKK